MKTTWTIGCGSVLLVISTLSGCATYDHSKEALIRADRALEQAELANQRIDKMMEAYGEK